MDELERRLQEDRLREAQRLQQAAEASRSQSHHDAINSTNNVDSAVLMAESLGILPAGTLDHIDAQIRREREARQAVPQQRESAPTQVSAQDSFQQAALYPYSWDRFRQSSGKPPDDFLGSLVFETKEDLDALGVRVWLDGEFLCAFPFVNGLALPIWNRSRHAGAGRSHTLLVRVFPFHSFDFEADEHLSERRWQMTFQEKTPLEFRVHFRLGEESHEWSAETSALAHRIFLASPNLPPANWAHRRDLIRVSADGQLVGTWPLLPLVHLPARFPTRAVRITLEVLHSQGDSPGDFRVVQQQILDGRLAPPESLIALLSVDKGTLLPHPWAVK